MNNTQILAAVARAVNDGTFTKRSKAVMLGILTDAQNYVIDQTECLRKIDSSSLTLAADTAEYTLPSTFIKFPTEESDTPRGFVAVGTNAKYTLTPTTPSLLNSQDPGWRNVSSGTPNYYYILKGGTLKIGIYPKPSASFISANGSPIYLDHIYRGADIVEDTNLPFDNAAHLAGIFQVLLKLRAIWQIKLEDMQFEDADRMDMKINKELLPSAIDFINSLHISAGPHGFELSNT